MRAAKTSCSTELHHQVKPLTVLFPLNAIIAYSILGLGLQRTTMIETSVAGNGFQPVFLYRKQAHIYQDNTPLDERLMKICLFCNKHQFFVLKTGLTRTLKNGHSLLTD